MRMLFLRGRTAHPPRKASPTAKRKPTRPAIQHRPRVVGLRRLLDRASAAKRLAWHVERYPDLPAEPAGLPSDQVSR